MEEFEATRDSRDKDELVRERSRQEDLRAGLDDLDLKTGTRSEEALTRLRSQRETEASRRKWGKVLIVAGLVTALDSCSVFPIPLIGPPAILAGAVMVLAGSALLIRSPRMRETNEALMIAMKHDNHLTVPRLALEMDITLKKAERIIQKLVRQGIAEIDLDDDDPDGGISYKVRGI